MKKSLLPFIAAGVLVCSLGACRSTNTGTGTSTTSPATTPSIYRNTFPVMAASFDLFEIQSSDLARTRALNPAVRIFAKMMRDHHGESSEELRSLAATKNITLPTTMLEAQQELMEPMNEVGIGEKFDRRYMDAQITAHERAISLFENAAIKETDAELRNFASRMVPKLYDHLALAKKAKDALN